MLLVSGLAVMGRLHSYNKLGDGEDGEDGEAEERPFD